MEHVHRSVEPNGDCLLLEELAGPGIDEHSAAGRNDLDLAVDQPRHEPPLTVAIILLAVALEELAPRQADRFLDLRIAVDERQAEPPGEPSPDSRLSYPHQTHQNDGAIKTLRQIHRSKGLYSGFRARQKRRHAKNCSPAYHRPARPRRSLFPVDPSERAAHAHDRSGCPAR